MQKLTTLFEGKRQVPIRFIETTRVKDGVIADVYAFIKDSSRDLAIVTVSKGVKTPLQKVLLGDMTIEGYLSGEGILTIQNTNGKITTHHFSHKDMYREVPVAIGECMQWHATGAADLVFYEICKPPYQDGRFQNITD